MLERVSPMPRLIPTESEFKSTVQRVQYANEHIRYSVQYANGHAVNLA